MTDLDRAEVKLRATRKSLEELQMNMRDYHTRIHIARAAEECTKALDALSRADVTTGAADRNLPGPER